MSDEHTNAVLRQNRIRRSEPNNCRNDLRFDEAEYIRELQSCLRRLEPEEDSRIIPDGVFGAETKEAVKRFQQAAGIEATGEVDRPTWNAIVTEAGRRS